MPFSVVLVLSLIYFTKQVDSLALHVVTYIGLGISLTCLLLTIIFFLLLG